MIIQCRFYLFTCNMANSLSHQSDLNTFWLCNHIHPHQSTKENQKQPPKLWEEKLPVLSVWAQGFLVTSFNQSCLPRMFGLHSLRSQPGWHPEVKANSRDSKTAQPLQILHSRSFIWKPLKEGKEKSTIEAWVGKMSNKLWDLRGCN